jgi:AcrR family transcriptional regulator
MSKDSGSGSTLSPGLARRPGHVRHEEILSVAAALFAERGFAGTGIDEIGTEVGVSGPALYRHVDSKEALLGEIAVGFADGLLATSQRACQAAAVPPPGLSQLVRAVVDACLDHPAELAVFLRTVYFMSPATLAQINVRQGLIRELWAPTLRVQLPAPALAEVGLYLRAAGGLIIGASRLSGKIPRDRLVDLTVAMISAMVVTAVPGAGDGSADDGSAERPGAGATWARASRREQLLDAAIRLFRERGYSGVSMVDIGAAVGISASAAYRHFKNKEDILAVAILRVGEQFTVGLNNALSAAVTADDALDKLLRSYVTISVGHHELVAVANSESHHLTEENKVERRRMVRLFNAEWLHCLAAVRGDLSAAELKCLLDAVLGLVTETVRSRRMNRRPNLAEELYVLARAVVYFAPGAAGPGDAQSG